MDVVDTLRNTSSMVHLMEFIGTLWMVGGGTFIPIIIPYGIEVSYGDPPKTPQASLKLAASRFSMAKGSMLGKRA